MKPTKKQKLAWIEAAMKWLENRPHDIQVYTCDAFNPTVSDFEDWWAWEWYRGVLDIHHGDHGFSVFSDVELNDRRGSRLLWLSFLHLWVSTGEVE